MSIEVEATYEGGVLKPDQPLPLEEMQRVKVVVQPARRRRVRDSAGIVPLPDDPEALDYLLGPDNHPWAK